MNEALIIDIGADISTLKYSIKEVSAELNKLKTTLKTAVGDEIVTLNGQIALLEGSLKNLKSVGKPVADDFGKIADVSKGARIALTSVNQVVQDLPFGFIGIQNNLPVLFQSFSKLSQESGGVVGAFKAIDKATLVTSGLFLAFNIATSAVTFLIQKYGSLSNAADALFGKTNLLAKAQEDYNKQLAISIGSSAKESAEIAILTKTLTDLSKPLSDRQAAYVELKKISPDVVAGLHLENISTADAIKLISANAKAIQELLLLKAQEAAISNVLTKNKEDLAKLQIEESKLTKEQTSAQTDYNKSKKDGFLVLGAGITSQQTALIALNDAASALSKNKLEQEKLNKVANEYVKLLEPTLNGIAAIDLKTKQLIDTEKKLSEASSSKVKKEKFKIEKPLDIEELARKARYKATELQNKADKNSEQAANAKARAEEIELNNLIKLSMSQEKYGNTTDLIASKNLDAALSFYEIQDAMNNMKYNFDEVFSYLQEGFFNPIGESFTQLVETGKITMKEVVKNIFVAISKIITKLITSKVLTLLANLIAPGSGFAVSAGLQAVGTAGLGDFLNISGGSANFAGVQGGGMGMSGSVNLVLRGTDLVGSINRTNMQLNRVG